MMVSYGGFMTHSWLLVHEAIEGQDGEYVTMENSTKSKYVHKHGNKIIFHSVIQPCIYEKTKDGFSVYPYKNKLI